MTAGALKFRFSEQKELMCDPLVLTNVYSGTSDLQGPTLLRCIPRRSEGKESYRMLHSLEHPLGRSPNHKSLLPAPAPVGLASAGCTSVRALLREDGAPQKRQSEPLARVFGLKLYPR